MHAGDGVPWDHVADCAIHVNHRLLRGFLIDIATIGGKVVGHAEWIISDEPPPYGRHLYLGLLQVHPHYRGRGVGRALVEEGIRKARALSCPVARTLPEAGAVGFYRKCGCSTWRRVVTYTAAVRPVALPPGWVRSRTVPHRAVAAFPMRFGWVQGSSVHRWEVCNRPARIFGDRTRHPCARRRDDRAFVQLRHLGDRVQAMALAWAPLHLSLRAPVAAAMALAGSLPVETVTFTVQETDEPHPVSCCDAHRTGVAEVWSRPVDP